MGFTTTHAHSAGSITPPDFQIQPEYMNIKQMSPFSPGGPWNIIYIFHGHGIDPRGLMML